MECEGSLLPSKPPSAGLYPESTESSPHLHIQIILRSIVMLFFHLRLGLP